MKLYPLLEQHMEFLSTKQKLYAAHPKWWDIKQKAFIYMTGFLIVTALPILALKWLGLILEVDCAFITGFVLGIYLGSICIVALIDEYLIKTVK